MSLRNLTKIEIEQMSLTDVAFELLKEKKGGQEFPKLFKEVCEIVGEMPGASSDKIGKFYSSLSFDRRFVILSDGTWDLRNRHTFEAVNPDFSDFDIDDDLIEDETLEEEEEEVFDTGMDDLTDDDEESDVEEDLKGLVPVDGDEIL